MSPSPFFLSWLYFQGTVSKNGKQIRWEIKYDFWIWRNSPNKKQKQVSLDVKYKGQVSKTWDWSSIVLLLQNDLEVSRKKKPHLKNLSRKKML